MLQEQFVEKQRVIYERKKTKSLTNLVGWYSDRTMKDDLKWPELFDCTWLCTCMSGFTGKQFTLVA